MEISQAGATPRFIFFSLGTLGSDYMYFKFSDEHPRLFHKGVTPGVYTRRQYNTDWEKCFDDKKLLTFLILLSG